MARILGTVASAYHSLEVLAFESIATSTTAGTISFTSIPQTFTHLQIRAIGKNSNGTFPSVFWTVRFNEDSGSNYDCHSVMGTGSSATIQGNGTYTNQMIAGEIPASGGGTPSSNSGPVIIDILDYTNNAKYKVMRSFGGYDANGNQNIRLCGGLWMNTAAITSVQLFGADVQVHAALYGIK